MNKKEQLKKNAVDTKAAAYAAYAAYIADADAYAIYDADTYAA